jgi:hypothetical protein
LALDRVQNPISGRFPWMADVRRPAPVGAGVLLAMSLPLQQDFMAMPSCPCDCGVTTHKIQLLQSGVTQKLT